MAHKRCPRTCQNQFHNQCRALWNERVVSFGWKLFFFSLPPSVCLCFSSPSCLFLLFFLLVPWSSCVSPPPLRVVAGCSGEPVRGSEEHRPSGHHQHAGGPAGCGTATSQAGVTWHQQTPAPWQRASVPWFDQWWVRILSPPPTLPFPNPLSTVPTLCLDPTSELYFQIFFSLFPQIKAKCLLPPSVWVTSLSVTECLKGPVADKSCNKLST